MRTAFRWLGTALLFLAIGLGFAPTIIPPFLDRIYYEGPASDHFDGARFFNPDRDADLPPPPSPGRGGLVGRLLSRDDRPPWPDRVEVTQTRPAPRVTGEAMVATWIGHASFLVQTAGLNILTDPILSDTAGPFGIGPRRVMRPGIAIDDLPRIDLVLVSHNHYDHLDIATLRRLWERDRPTIVTSLGNDTILRAAGIEARALDWGGMIYRHDDGRWLDVAPVDECVAEGCPPIISVTVNRNHHWGSRWFTDRNRALWSSFVVRLPGGNLFFAGDTGFGDGNWANEAAALGPVRLALLPIGAFRFTAGQMETGSHIGPAAAVDVFARLGASRALAMHWGTFRLSSEAWATPPRLLVESLRCAGDRGGRFTPVRIGAPVAVPAYTAPPRFRTSDRAEILRCLDANPAVRALR
jgi:L-ascorbate metabolism protein UlaG (beta-lactamase superfamily)